MIRIATPKRDRVARGIRAAILRGDYADGSALGDGLLRFVRLDHLTNNPGKKYFPGMPNCLSPLPLHWQEECPMPTYMFQ